MVRTSDPSRLLCCTWSSRASHQYKRSALKSTLRPLGQPKVTLRNTIKLLPSVCARLMFAGLSHSEKKIYLSQFTRVTVSKVNIPKYKK